MWSTCHWCSGFHPSKGSTSQLTTVHLPECDPITKFPSLKGFDLAADSVVVRYAESGTLWFPSLKGFDLAADSVVVEAAWASFDGFPSLKGFDLAADTLDVGVTKFRR